MKTIVVIAIAVLSLQAKAELVNPSSVGDFLAACGKEMAKHNEGCLPYVLGARLGFAASQHQNPACAEATLHRPPLALMGMLQRAEFPASMPMVQAVEIVMRAERNCRVSPSQRAPL